MSKCYMCDQISVGKEHVPPRCLFPNSKDLPTGINLRKDLITVPSCDEHNSEKSHEDQYFLNVITSCEMINEVEREHYRKLMRRQNQRNNSILARFVNRSVEIGNKLAHKVEIDRLDSFVRHLACALYFAHFRSRWDSDLKWVPEFLTRIADSDKDAERARLAIVEESNFEFRGVPYHGANPQVFVYQVIGTKEQCKMRLGFYEGCMILLIFSECNSTDVLTLKESSH